MSQPNWYIYINRSGLTSRYVCGSEISLVSLYAWLWVFFLCISMMYYSWTQTAITCCLLFMISLWFWDRFTLPALTSRSSFIMEPVCWNPWHVFYIWTTTPNPFFSPDEVISARGDIKNLCREDKGVRWSPQTQTSYMTAIIPGRVCTHVHSCLLILRPFDPLVRQ